MALSPATVPTPTSPVANAYVTAFQESCLNGLPDLNSRARNAGSRGWVETSIRPIGPVPAQLAGSLPRVFRRNGMMLFLTAPSGGEFAQVCQIASEGGTKLSAADIIAAAAPIVGDATAVMEKRSGDEGARWMIAPKRDVFAGVGGPRKVKTLSLVVRDKR
jgi:hypothetical protein